MIRGFSPIRSGDRVSYGESVLNEPVRGAVPEQGVFSLSGLEILRAYMRGSIPSTPLYRLFAPRVTQASSGTTVIHQVLSPWFQMNEDFVDLTATSQYIIETTALTAAPPGSYVRTVNTSVRYLRPCTVQNELVIGRGRVLHAGGSFVTVEALFEDALGRAVAHATGSVTITTMAPPPPPLASPLQPVDEPAYLTPDPMNRPLDVEGDGEGALPPFGQFLGARLLDVDAGMVRIALPTSEWFCLLRREVAPGIIGLLGNLAIGRSITELIDGDQRYVILQATTTAMAPVAADGRLLTAVGAVRHRRDDVVVAEAEVSDEDGNTVAIVQGPCLVRERGDHARRRMTDRVLLTVLFTDLVGSTQRAQQLGDARWRELLEQHDVLCRRQVALYTGRGGTSSRQVTASWQPSTRRVVPCDVPSRSVTPYARWTCKCAPEFTAESASWSATTSPAWPSTWRRVCRPRPARERS